MSDAACPSARGWGRIPRVAIVLVVLLVILLLTLLWVFLSRHELDQVDVTASEPVCSGTIVGHQDDSDLGHIPVVPARPGMRCVVAVSVTNKGHQTIRIRRLAAEWLGGGSGVPVKGTSVDGRTPVTDPVDDRVSSYGVDEALAPGAKRTLHVAYVFRPSGCNAADVFASMRWPWVEVSMLGVNRERDANGVLAITGSGTNCGDGS